MAEETISNSNKKMFTESWNTDKARFEKRQVKYNKPQNFLLFMEDNIHQAGQEQSARSVGKLMVYGKGTIKENFLNDGIKYDTLNYIINSQSDDGERKKKKAKNQRKQRKQRRIIKMTKMRMR